VSVVQLRDAADRREYGGKTASLARLASYGLPVPNGFCIPCSTATCLNPHVLQEIQDHLRCLETTHVAVRSSASMEDSQASSLAGIFRSELKVPATVPDVAHAISKVVQSVSNAALLPYLQRLGIRSKPHMAVLVQVMLQPRIAGVLFTCDPITERSDFIIETSLDPEMDVQAGHGSPERIVVERGSSRSLGPVHRSTSPGSFPALDAQTMHTLINLALKCEGILGRGQDIEWAVEKGSVWILQSRPITGLSRNAE
jgi:phosphoenolpyruvate synthase/pyruvate phosphate dikinase